MSRRVDHLRDTAVARLRRNGQRMTTGREQLLTALAAAGRPLTIPEILASRRGLAQSSVYRNLVVLEEAAVVRRVVTTNEHARFELAEGLTEHHHHLVCSACGRVEDLPATPALERSLAATVRAARATGFRTDHHRLDLVGRCAGCA